FKSGRKGFWPTHEAQLHIYRMMWNAVFGEKVGLEVTHVFNWAPNKWRDKPTYKLQNQTESIERENIPDYLNIFKRSKYGEGPSRTVVDLTAPIKWGEPLEGCYEVKTYEQLAIERYNANRKANSK
ncbi:MAG: hypothetical protein KDD04_10665, partial [Sinomicrobium sp.]|nr:hypothetical protein [Sinomicrobium sp.]